MDVNSGREPVTIRLQFGAIRVAGATLWRSVLISTIAVRPSGAAVQSVPALDDLAADWKPMAALEITPAVCNFHGGLSVGRDLLSVTELNQPPLSLGGFTAELSIDGKAAPAQESRWYPYQVLRRTTTDRLEVVTAVRMAVEQGGVLFRAEVRNLSAQVQTPALSVELSGRVRQFDTVWEYEYPRPADHDFKTELRIKEKALLIRDAQSPACAAFAFVRTPDQVLIPSREVGALAENPSVIVERGDHGDAVWKLALKPGETQTIEFVMAVGTNQDRVVASAAAWAADFAGVYREARDLWQARFNAAFTPGNGHFSGHLPVLTTPEPKLRRLYYMSVVSWLALERTNLNPRHPRVFVSGSPGHSVSVSYYWDAIDHDTLWCLLDPAGVQDILRAFLAVDIHKSYALDWLSLKGVGPWYSANDSTIFRLLTTYLFVTGDWAFLQEDIGGKKGMEVLDDLATHWKQFVTDTSGLADYGGAANLLETVPTYVQRVPSFNAANVWMMRTAAAIHEKVGEAARARELRVDADRLAQAVLALYVPGKGYWCCLLDKGRRVEVRHCIDFYTLALCMLPDLPETTRKEMMAFAADELLSPPWMRALSLKDGAATRSLRTDHGSTGAFDGWLPLTADAFFVLGRPDTAVETLLRAEALTREGPYGQMHRLNPLRKSADWADYYSAPGAALAEGVLRTLFGFTPDIQGRILRQPETPRGFKGRLSGVRYQGALYTLTSTPKGIQTEKSRQGDRK